MRKKGNWRRGLAIALSTLMLLGSTNLEAFTLNALAAEPVETETELEISEEVSEEISEKVSEENSEEGSEAVSEEETEEVSEETTEEETEEVSEETTEEETEEVSEETTEEESEEISEELTEEVSDETTDDTDSLDRAGGLDFDNQTIFPDAQLRAYLKAYFGKSELTNSDIYAVKSLDISGENAYGIENLKGIEKFTKVESIECHTRSLKKADLSAVKSLKTIDMSGCSLNEIKLSSSTASTLIELDLSDNLFKKSIALKNYTKLERVDLSKNEITEIPELSSTSILYFDCSDNKLSELNLAELINVEVLNCSNNNLRALEVNRCIKLEELDCSGNELLSSLIFVAIDETTNQEVYTGDNLWRLDISYCAFSDIDLARLKNLAALNCSHNRFEKLKLDKNTKLDNLDCSYNNLRGLDITKNTEIDGNTLFCNNNNLYFINVADGFQNWNDSILEGNKHISDSNEIKFDTGFKKDNVFSLDENLVYNKENNASAFVIVDGAKPAKYTYAINKYIKVQFTLTVLGNTYSVESIQIPFTKNMNPGENGKIYATVMPGEASGLPLLYSSSNESVATIDENGNIVAVGPGRTTILVKSKENPEIVSNACNLTVNSVVEAPEDTVVVTYAGSRLKLGNVPVPESIRDDYTWEDPELLLSSYKDTKTIFNCVRKEDKKVDGVVYETAKVAVYFVSIADIQVNVDNTTIFLGANPKSAILTITPVYSIEYRPVLQNMDAKDYVMDFTTSNRFTNVTSSNRVDVTNQGKVSVTDITKKGTVKIKSELEVLCEGRVCVNKAKNMSIKVEELASSADISVTSVTRNGIAVDFERDDLKPGDELIIKAEATGIPAGKKVKLTSSNSKVLKIAEIKDPASETSTYKATVTGYGTAKLTYTAVKNSKVKKQAVVLVRNYAPALVTPEVSVNRFLKNKSAQFILMPSFETAYSDVSVSAVKENTKAAPKDFTITRVGDANSNLFNIAVNGNLTKGKYTLTLTTKINGEDWEIGVLKVNVTEKKPSLSIKQTKKVNLFYDPADENHTGKLEIKETTSGKMITNASISNADFTYDEQTGELSLNYGANSANPNKKATVTVKFDDYEYYDIIEKNITISTENKAPSVTVETANKIINTKLNMDSTGLIIRANKKSVSQVVSVDFVKGGDAVKELGNMELKRIEGVWTVCAKEGKKLVGGNYPLYVQDISWTKPVKVNLVLNVTTGTPPVKAEKETLVLNQKLPAYDQSETAVSITTSGEYFIQRAYIKPDVDAAKIKDFVTVYYDSSEQKIKAKFTVNYFESDRKADAFNGTYTYKVTPIVGVQSDTGLVVMGGTPITIKIKLINQDPKVSVKTSGSIDLVNRRNSGITLTPSFSNVNGTIKKIEVAGANRSMFKLEEVMVSDKKTVQLRANENGTYRIGSKYDVYIKYTLCNDRGECSVRSQKISVQLKQSSVSVKLGKTNLLLSSRAKNIELNPIPISCKSGILDRASVSIASDATGQFVVDRIEAEDGQNAKIYLKVKDGANLTPGKTYSVKLNIAFWDSGFNAKNTSVTVKVKVMK